MRGACAPGPARHRAEVTKAADANVKILQGVSEVCEDVPHKSAQLDYSLPHSLTHSLTLIYSLTNLFMRPTMTVVHWNTKRSKSTH